MIKTIYDEWKPADGLFWGSGRDIERSWGFIHSDISFFSANNPYKSRVLAAGSLRYWVV
jgi:hypothetical protein